MNKLAVLAFTLLVFFSAMLWYLAKGSLNDYLKSQLQLQGQYYTEQVTKVTLADFSSDSGVGRFTAITLANPLGYQSEHALIIDEASFELAAMEHNISETTSVFKQQALITIIKKLTIKKLVINSETKYTDDKKSQNNISQLTAKIQTQLAQDYPEFYPEISAKYYAEQNPQLNAERYAQNHPDAGPMIAHKQKQKTRDKTQAKLSIEKIIINTLEVNIIDNGTSQATQYKNITLPTMSSQHDMQALVSNQLGGEVLLVLLGLSQSPET